MSIKACEVSLALWTRKVRPDGTVIRGGTMFYIERVPVIGPILAMLFALFACIAAFGIGNMCQANSVAEGAEYIAKAAGVGEAGIFNIRVVIGILLVIFVGLVIIGGIKRIAKIVTYVVPFMCVWYMIFGIGLILYKITDLPSAIYTVVKYAFTPSAAVGGFAGATVFFAFRYGLARGLFSNEAGMGSAPMIYAFSESDHPGRMAFFGMFEVLLDTFMCLITGLVIVITSSWESGLIGTKLTMEGFSRVYGAWGGIWPAIILGVALMLVAFSTILTWYFYGEATFKYFFSRRLKIISERKATWLYRIMWLPPLLLAAVAAGYLETIWAFADTFNGLMAVPNLAAIIFFIPITMRMLKHYVWVYLPSLKKPGLVPDGGEIFVDEEGTGLFARWSRAAFNALTKEKNKK
jgi:Na+/alanine symporter